ncbi:MAG: hypothetical protein AVDCRST_MAG42-1099 [uncultured Chthoniobacterales bacterium]|uniref:Peptidase S1 domain-containing protein n=1 Tax=uncultured Chthoniobacterales bacterium TaxID=1836801 RepID=A0A6J4HT71_9BACT|nr:MAG: hypothetical protein AVDCRST_MAG42-1099 [uncultured Chthoniobacterales bacterium]
MSASKQLLARILWLVALLCSGAPATRGVILFGTEGNTTPPTEELADSGWQYQGVWGDFLGTPIAPRFFLTAAHIGNPGVLVYNGISYTVIRTIFDPAESDLRLYEVSTAFPTFAPLYTSHDEVGKPLVVFGRGTQRGEPILFGAENELRGWYHGGGAGTRRWGTNTVTGVVADGPDDELLYASFDAGVSPNEAHLSGGDSGGGTFIQEGGVWKLAGINYAIDGPFSPDGSDAKKFDAAFFDASDFYLRTQEHPPVYTFLPGPGPVPSAFYTTRISSRTGWLYSVTDPLGDLDADGTPNLGEYGQHLDPAAADVSQVPQLGREGDALTLTYRKRTTATDLRYLVESSQDLASWSPAGAQEQIVSTEGTVQTIKATVPISGGRLFLRLRIARP